MRLLKHCLVAVDVPPGSSSPSGPHVRPVSLPVDATVADALAYAGIDDKRAQTGIWGTCCDRSMVPQEGDRIEVYRPLTSDPRKRRREQVVRAARRGGKRAGAP